ncbi:bifunctional 2-C-methyl-D-erythritol 4-phosphate cytidylyltransferase/2-C-methyl-D-erythritol 2,4-cyclodiphosphate synthase [Rhodovulum tesquicola]|uniref:bifunctional 2-C-methyl-D-erythritol 4-phosphate cytidylyltransferase/2-C-methyl-D-erythritol 2,4-cyclodiphosphate synthase n=1 Tax=Rhodovulum tesquicola TaxID=540254 RepID=UPI0020969923|nr:bifunctional 2-C-methyl-D-erythritol 4-phosphate cytidylyltransferase/2-C-methyl-D-erythritol 2,4-cyclodiphosphate synthase [Rhodovulum tesquicola]MCO8145940.1 bifunctional 2-C-methyl-D-erythritol 4-phosphate cytidylyltransferase/2-C-methyl-D-erythritol 2,4-cyclodiphosphate synthase [Rhodovulum tesquicola]
MTVTAIIVAAGRGTRAGGDRPKQYQRLGGRAVLGRTVAAFAAHPRVSGLVVVQHPDDADLFAEAMAGLDLAVTRVPGGATRDASVAAGLGAVPPGTTRVLIHDGARPLVSAALIDRVIDALDTHPGAAPALAVTDALWRGAAGRVLAPHPRDGLFRAQTPQGFRIEAIRAAHAAHPGGAADDVEVALAAGLDVAIVEGDEDNLKITHAQDFARAERVLRERDMDIRTGNGFDVHAFCEGDGVILCGIKVPHDKALKGHSDADVGMHAVTDAIYGALADGDIGQHFPPSDPQWKGAASDIFLKHAVGRVAERGYRIAHADLTLICERPKIGPVAGAMRAEMARLMGIELDRISVKATTSEQLGFTGREEGIAALATVTLVRP